MLWDMFSKWLKIFLKISSALHPLQGMNAHARLEKSSVLMNGCCKHCFLAANAGLWISTYQLQEIAWNLDLSRVEVEWNLPCHRTSCCFFFKIFPHPCIVTALVCYLYGEFSALMDTFPSLSFVRDFPRLQTKILWTTKISLVSYSCRIRQQKWNRM